MIADHDGMILEQRDVVSRDGTRLRCWITGRGRPLVVSNPLGIHPQFWLPLARRLDGRFSLILWQGRGMWDSALPADPSAVTVADHSDDLRAIVADMRLDWYGLIGYCAGSFSACNAFQDPAFRPARVMFISALLRRSGTERVITKLITRVEGRPRARHTLFSFVWEFAPPQFRDCLEATLQDERRLFGFLRAVQNMYEFEPLTSPGPDQPICLVVARDDRESIKSSNLAYLRSRDRAGDALIEAEGGHYFVLERPETAERLIVDYFSPRPATQETAHA
jgi:hypothetical protein